MRICIISNSHAGALKHALDTEPALAQGHDISFFASRGAKVSKFTLIDDVISTTDLASVRYATGGKFTQIAPGDFDALVFYGIQLRFGHWLFPPEDADWGIANASSAFRGEMIIEHLSNSMAVQFAYLVCASPVWQAQVVVAPSPVQAAPDIARSAPFPLDEINLAAATMCSGFGARFVPQPKETLAATGFTYDRFAKGSLRLNEERAAHDDTERKHMNAAFGALILRDILAALR
ncbi:MAG: hypothetical protein WD046_01190 [Paracoccaceae bacterium]